jgi:hypothetical protein
LSAYQLTGSIIFELPDDDKQLTEQHVCLLFVTSVNKEDDASIQFYFENTDTKPIEKHVYSLFIAPADTAKNEESIRFYLANQDDVDEHY